MRTLDSRPSGILLAERCGFLMLSSQLQCFMARPSLQADDPRFLLRLRTAGTVGTRSAILAGESCLKGYAILWVGIGQPGNALLARRAGHHTALPVHDETSLVEACPVAGLPSGVIGHGTDDRHAMLTLAMHEHMRIGIALVNQMLRRQQVTFLQRFMDFIQHIIVWRCRRR